MAVASPMLAIPNTSVDNTSGAMTILISSRKISARIEEYLATSLVVAASRAQLLQKDDP
jgi:hypothetical protein